MSILGRSSLLEFKDYDGTVQLMQRSPSNQNLPSNFIYGGWGTPSNNFGSYYTLNLGQSHMFMNFYGKDTLKYSSSFGRSSIPDFNRPLEVTATTIPKCFKEIYDIQNALSNYDSSNTEQTELILNFIKQNPNIGLREFEINAHLLPKLIKHYVKLYTMFPQEIRLFARTAIRLPSFFSHYLMELEPQNEYEASQLSSKFTNEMKQHYVASLVSKLFRNHPVGNRECLYDLLDAIVDDNVDFFVSFTSKQDYINDSVYRTIGYATLIEHFAFYGSVNCFKFLLMNNVNLKGIAPFALAGGNIEIIRLLIQKEVDFKNVIDLALFFRHDELYDWLNTNFMTDEELAKASSSYAMTETLSIQALLCLMEANDLTNMNDFMYVCYLDKQYEIVEHLSPKAIFNTHLFYMITDEKILNNLLDHTPIDYYSTLFLHCVSYEFRTHLKIMIAHDLFDDLSIPEERMGAIKFWMPEIYQLINDVSNDKSAPPQKLYKRYLNKHKISREVTYKVIMYCHEINDARTIHKLVTNNYGYLSRDELLDVIQKCPYVSNMLIKNEVDRYYHDDIDIQVALFQNIRLPEYSKTTINFVNLVAANPEVFKRLCIFDFLSFANELALDHPFLSSHLQDYGINVKEIPSISENLTEKALSTLEAESHTSRDDVSPIFQIIVNSDAFKEYFKDHYKEFMHYLYYYSELVYLYEDIEFTKEIFDEFVRIIAFIHKTLKKDLRHDKNCHPDLPKFVEILLKPQNRKFLDLKTLTKSRHNQYLISKIDYTQEEFDIIKANRSYHRWLLGNPYNGKYFTPKELFKFPMDEVVESLLVIDITPQLAQMIRQLTPEHPIFRSKTMERPEFLQILSTQNLLNVLAAPATSSVNSSKYLAMKELMTRQRSNAQNLTIILNMPAEPECFRAIEEARDTLSVDCLIMLSCKKRELIVEKGTQISESAFVSMVTKKTSVEVESVKFCIENYGPTVTALTKGMLVCKRADVLDLLLQSGAYIDTVSGDIGGTYLMETVIENEYDLADVLLNHGADVSYRFSSAAQSCQDLHPPVQKKILERTSPEKEIRYDNIQKHMNYIYKLNVRTDLLYSVTTMSSAINRTAPSMKTRPYLVYDACKQNSDIVNFRRLIHGSFSIASSFPQALYLFGQITPEYNQFIYRLIKGYKGSQLPTSPEFKAVLDEEIKSAHVAYKNVYSILEGVDMLEAHPENADLLFLATRTGKIELIRKLLELGANINEVEGYYFLNSPALDAILHNRADILQLFIDYGLDVDQVYTSDNYTLINAAIEFNSVACFDILLEKASLEHRAQLSPMTCALIEFEKGNQYFVQKLLPKIDLVLERIESHSFVHFEECQRTGEQFAFTGQGRLDELYFPFEPFSQNDYENIDVAQKILMMAIAILDDPLEIETNHYTLKPGQKYKAPAFDVSDYIDCYDDEY